MSPRAVTYQAHVARLRYANVKLAVALTTPEAVCTLSVTV
jgi:hypothetical protein